MEGNVAATYTLIYHFLKQQSQHRAAEAVKKAAKSTVVLRDDIEQGGTPLEDIIKEWKTKKNTIPGNADSSAKDLESSGDSSSDSKDDSTSDSSSEDTSGSEGEDGDTNDKGGSDEATAVKKLPPKAAERDTSVTLSSAGENALGAAKQAARVAKTRPTKDQIKDSESNSSDSDSSDSDSSSKSSDSEPSSSSSSSPSSSDSSDEVEANASERARPDGTKTTEDRSSSTSESSSDSEDQSDSESQHPAKRRKTLESEAALTTESQRIAKASQIKDRLPSKVRERFQRVKVRNLEPELLLDNDYEARGGAINDYGERAHRDLIMTRGAGFRKEKNKKKRGSYRGGEITMENHSIKFDF